MAQDFINNSLHVREQLSCGTFSPPSGCIDDNAVESAAGIQATKLEHQYHQVYSQANGTANAAKRHVIHIAYGATGDIIAVKARNTTAATGVGYTTVNILKNGTTILSAVITLDASASTTVQSGTLATTTYVTGDVFEVVIATSGSNEGQGVGVQLILREDAQ